MNDSFQSLRPTVAVLGCGWLGLPLAKALVADGYSVGGTTTTPSRVLTMRHAGIRPYLLSLGGKFTATDRDTLHTLLSGTDVLVLNVPPRRGASTSSYSNLLHPVAEAVKACRVSHVLFVSSTSVYPDEPRAMHEADAQAASDAASDMLRAEDLFAPHDASQGQPGNTVVRLAGLFGPQRPPGRFLAGRLDVAQANAPVNLIHLTDCVGLLSAIIRQQAWGYTFNACAISHPVRGDFYPKAARQLGLQPPDFRLDDALGGKTIDSTLIRQTLDYRFQHDDLEVALAAC
ncbi:NAD(P)-dependent oxidoreductase [Hymenobacter qilianensis]|uniref:NAD(P)-dependent oxidoreductase n=2 Tax=Hymenobacter qilianensis TaxID=1385715 RepID=A0ACB5PU95_9BACT|nr:NAD(P)H-binding protein [Hymenobacter qilianensis]QNP51711.1 NAD(P)H-binding protein [Hymenobacter qilianensis]GGF72604.1 NAD(P)-dependent oxidoreductase [Hymenobacter qilianensis]